MSARAILCVVRTVVTRVCRPHVQRLPNIHLCVRGPNAIRYFTLFIYFPKDTNNGEDFEKFPDALKLAAGCIGAGQE